MNSSTTSPAESRPPPRTPSSSTSSRSFAVPPRRPPTPRRPAEPPQCLGDTFEAEIDDDGADLDCGLIASTDIPAGTTYELRAAHLETIFAGVRPRPWVSLGRYEVQRSLAEGDYAFGLTADFRDGGLLEDREPFHIRVDARQLNAETPCPWFSYDFDWNPEPDADDEEREGIVRPQRPADQSTTRPRKQEPTPSRPRCLVEPFDPELQYDQDESEIWINAESRVLKGMTFQLWYTDWITDDTPIDRAPLSPLTKLTVTRELQAGDHVLNIRRALRGRIGRPPTTDFEFMVRYQQTGARDTCSKYDCSLDHEEIDDIDKEADPRRKAAPRRQPGEKKPRTEHMPGWDKTPSSPHLEQCNVGWFEYYLRFNAVDQTAYLVLDRTAPELTTWRVTTSGWLTDRTPYQVPATTRLTDIQFLQEGRRTTTRYDLAPAIFGRWGQPPTYPMRMRILTRQYRADGKLCPPEEHYLIVSHAPPAPRY